MASRAETENVSKNNDNSGGGGGGGVQRHAPRLRPPPACERTETDVARWRRGRRLTAEIIANKATPLRVIDRLRGKPRPPAC